MDKEINREDIDMSVDNFDVLSETPNAEEQVAPETEAEEVEAKAEETEDEPTVRRAYMPRFTEASERYRMKGDAKIRERLGLKPLPEEKPAPNPDEIRLDPTAEFEADVNGVDAKTPERSSELESDESINVMKFSPEENSDEEDIEARKAREEIEKLLRAEPKFEPSHNAEDELEAEDDEQEDEQDEDIFESVFEVNGPDGEEEVIESERIPETEYYEMADPDSSDFGVYDFTSPGSLFEDEDAPEGADEAAPTVRDKNGRIINREFTNPAQRDSFKDKFLDLLISIRIRMGASLIFALAMLVFELLSATKLITFKLFGDGAPYSTLGIVDFLLAACLLVMALPEIVKAARHLKDKKLMPDLLPVPAFIVLGLYTLAVALTGATSYALFGVLFAFVVIPLLSASLYRTKADFIAFKMVSAGEDKQIIDKKNTRELNAENMALDGIVDEYKSQTARTFRTDFVSDFFKHSAGVQVSTKHTAMIFGIPFGVAAVAAAIAFFLSWSPVIALEVLTFVILLGCPAFAIIANKTSYFYTQRAALLSDSAAIGEDAYHNFSSVDVFAFDDTDIFGPDDVNLKRFMLYGERDSMEKVMRQMSALFAAVGGPLDYMFSGIVDNRVRHKAATNMVIEDDGICGEVAGHKICAGSEDYMRRNGIALPAAATAPETGVSIDTIKIMYAAEDGEVYAKFYIRYSFSEEFTMTLPSLREAGIIPLVYTRDPNVSSELIATLTAGNGNMRVVKLYKPLKEEKVYNRVSASMVTYGDKLDAAGMIVLSKKYKSFSIHVRFAELCAMVVGILLALVLSIIGFGRVTVLLAAIWQPIWCFVLRFFSKTVFLKDAKKKAESQDQ